MSVFYLVQVGDERVSSYGTPSKFNARRNAEYRAHANPQAEIRIIQTRAEDNSVIDGVTIFQQGYAGRDGEVKPEPIKIKRISRNRHTGDRDWSAYANACRKVAELERRKTAIEELKARDLSQLDSTVRRVLDLWSEGEYIAEIARRVHISEGKVRRILIDNDVISTTAALLYKVGTPIDEIADMTRHSAKAVNSSLPYIKGMYNSDIPTINALRIRKTRSKEQEQ